MKRYLLDTGPLTALLFQRPWIVGLATAWIEQREASTSILVYGEIVEYLQGQPNGRERQRQLRRLLREILPYLPTYATLDRYATIRRQLRPPHGLGLIGDIDTVIAATALDRNLTVVTMDADFTRVPALDVLLVGKT